MKTKIRVLSAIMTVVMILSSLVIVIPTSVSAEAVAPAAVTTDTDLWTAHAATAIAKGAGTEADPYQITTAAELAFVAVKINANDDAYKKAHYKVMNDIDASAHQWMPIGIGGSNSTMSFLGTFDGGNCTITTVVNNAASYSLAASSHIGGLFGRFGGGTIKNVKLNHTFVWDQLPKNAYSAFYGGIAGTMYGTSTIDNCHVTVNATGITMSKSGDTYYTAPVSVFGGLVGYANATATISNCSVQGSVNLTTYDKNMVNGDTTNDGKGTPCHWNGTPDTSKKNYATFNSAFVGGMLGRWNGNPTLTNVVNLLDITMVAGYHNDAAGGIAAIANLAGGNKMTVKNYVDAGSFTASSAAGVAALVKYASIVGCLETKSQSYVIENVLSMPTISIDAPAAMDQYRSVAALFADVDADGQTVTANVKNFYTGTGAMGDIFVSNGASITVTADTLTEAKKLDGVTLHDIGIAKDIDFATAVDAKAGTSTITVPAGIMAALNGIKATVAVTKGGATPTETATNSDGALVATFGVTEGTASLAITLSNGKTLTYNDTWVNRANPLIKSSTEDGSASKPYLIDNAGELAYLAFLYNDQNQYFGAHPSNALLHVKLNADIDLAHSEWVSIGSYTGGNAAGKDLRARVHLDGDGRTISNLTQIMTPGDRPSGLFGAMKNSDSLVENFNLTGTIKKQVTKNSSSTGVAMVIGGFASGNCNIENVHVDAVIEVENLVNSGAFSVAGIVAYGNNVDITNCTMSGSVTHVATKYSNQQPLTAGILAAGAGNDHIIGCVNYADIYSYAGVSNSFAGGIVAYNSAAPSTNSGGLHNNTDIINCVNYGDITMSTASGGNQRAGGILGQAGRSGNGKAYINGCTNFGKIGLAEGVAKGGASGLEDIIGHAEAKTQTNETLLKWTDISKAVTVANVLSFKKMTTENMWILGNLGGVLYTIDPANPNDRTKDVLMTKVTVAYNTTSISTYAIEGEEYYFEIGTMEKDGKAIISASKIALDIFVGAGYKMNLTYNGKVIATDLSKATVSESGRAYEWTVEGEDYKAGQKASLTVTDPIAKYAPITAGSATWAGVYASKNVKDADGDGYYDIKTAGDLGYVARMANKISTNKTWKTAKMEMLNDIDFAGAYFDAITQTHTDDFGFRGQFIGTKSETENYKILNIAVGTANYVYNRSMFGKTFENFVFKDVDFVNPRVIGVSPNSNAGAGATSMTGGGLIAGSMYGNGLIENVNITGLTYDISGANSYYGGVVGYMAHKDAIVRDVTVQGKVIGSRGQNTSTNFGGIVHRIRLGTIENCVVDLDIDISFDTFGGNNYIGMIAAYAYGNSNSEKTYIKNNTALGSIDVTVGKDKAGTINSRWVAYAGIVGYIDRWGEHHITGNVADVEINLHKTATNSITLGAGAIVAVTSARAVDDAKVAGVDPTISNNYSLNGLTIIPFPNCTIVGQSTNLLWNVGGAIGTDGKASVRIDKTSEANSGIRFDSYINSVLYNAMKADSNVQVEIGTLIAPTVLMKAYNGKFDQLPAVVKVAYDVDAYAADGKGVEGFASIADGKSYFTGALVNVLPNNYKLEFTAVAYVTVTIHGVSHTYYAAYDANDEERARSIYDVALDAYNDREATYSAEYGTFVGDNAEKGNYSCYSTAQLNVLREYLGI